MPTSGHFDTLSNIYGLSSTTNPQLTLPILALLVVFTVHIAHGQTSLDTQDTPPLGAEVEVLIELQGGPSQPVLHLSFRRQSAIEEELVVTALSITDSHAPQRVNSVKLGRFGGAYASHLTGWFVVQQESQELWLGMSLDRGVAVGDLTISVPGLLSRIRPYPEEYELRWRKPNATLRELAEGAPSVVYATPTTVTLREPSWGTAIPQPDSSWKRVTGLRYELSPDHLTDKVHAITIEKNPSMLSDWLKQELGSFFLGVTGTGILLVVLLGNIPALAGRRRFIFGALALGLAAVLVYLGGSPWNWRVVVFRGALLLGALLAVLPFVLVPDRWLPNLRVLVREATGTT